MTLGSLFDGIGGFPLAGVMCGITPVWSSEIEPFPLKVTAARFPDMKQLGSVTDINGAEIEPVDIITFGSPCQDLSVAGKQLGIHEGRRSNLFFEAVRIIKEMRDATGSDEHIRPRFAVWENVPGAFSSNKGADFQAVLQALASVSCNGVSIPRPKKWNHAGCVVGNGWSIAWRVYDAQYWGVPQRRKRIYLVADFGSERAGEILFEREGVSGDSSESGTAGKGIAADAERSVGRSGGVKCLNPWDCQSKRQYDVSGVYRTLDAGESAGGQAHGVVYEPKSLMEENWAERDVKGALRAEPSKSASCVVEPVVYAMDAVSSNSMKSSNPHSGFHEEQVARTLDTRPDPTCNQGGNVVVQPVYALQGNGIDRADTAGCNGKGWREDAMYTLDTVDRPAVVYPEKARTLAARHDSSPCVDRGQNVVCYGVDCRNATLDEEKTHTVQAKANGGISLNCTPSVCYRNSGYGDMVEGVGTLRANGGDAGGEPKASLLNVFDARGNGDGDTAPCVTGDHNGHISDYTAVVVERNDE
mgnify:CR=1 FL=1